MPPSRDPRARGRGPGDAGAALRLDDLPGGGRLFALRIVIVLVLLMAAQIYDGSLHAWSHWIILGIYAGSSIGFGLAEQRGRHGAGFAWAGTVLNAGLAAYVIVEHLLAGDVGSAERAADTVSHLPAFLLLLQTALTMRVWHTAVYAGIVAAVWSGTLLVAHLLSGALLGPHVDLAEQLPGLLTFAAASLVVIDGVGRMRGAVRKALRLEHERTLLARFVPDDVALDLARQRSLDGELGTVRRCHACLMVLDIRGFSRLSREHAPETMVEALLAFRALVQAVVSEHGGLVDKYVGDAVLAQFVVGEPEAQAHSALACACAVRTRLAALNRERAERFPLRVAVALHAGELLVGIFDDGVRAEYTVLGPAMNTLARIEARTKAAERDIAASEDFLRLLGPVLPPGITLEAVADTAGPPDLYAVRDCDRAAAHA